MHVTEIETLHFANLTQYPMPRNVTSTDFRPSRRSHLLNIILRVGLCPKCVLVSGVLSEWGFVRWGFVRVGFVLDSEYTQCQNVMPRKCLNESLECYSYLVDYSAVRMTTL